MENLGKEITDLVRTIGTVFATGLMTALAITLVYMLAPRRKG